MLIVDLGTIDLVILLIINFHAMALSTRSCAFMTL